MGSKLSKINLNDYKPLRDVIFDSLREAIIQGELKPGERLMEVQLAEKMGVSRTPVREAIRKLELEGLVTMLPRKGAHVADLSVKDIIDVLEIRMTLDGLASSLSSKRITPEEIKELKHVNSQFASYIEKENVQGLIKKDVEFHEIIYKASRNEKLLQIANNLKEQVNRFRIIYLKDYSSHIALASEHDSILSAIEKGDEKLARELAEMHIKHQQETMLKAVEKNKKTGEYFQQEE